MSDVNLPPIPPGGGIAITNADGTITVYYPPGSSGSGSSGSGGTGTGSGGQGGAAPGTPGAPAPGTGQPVGGYSNIVRDSGTTGTPGVPGETGSLVVVQNLPTGNPLVVTGPGDITPYVDRITSEHIDKPKFFASLSVLLQPMADIMQAQCDIPGLFDIEYAVGVQLDAGGQWAGASRELLLPLTNVYFTWGGNDPSVGWTRGTWWGPSDPIEGLSVLNDTDYRNYIWATVLANQWDGSIPELYNILYTLIGEGGGVFAALLDSYAGQMADSNGNPIALGNATNFLIQDNGDMSFSIALGNVTAVAAALLVNGYLNIKPAGVRMNVIQPSVITSPATPLFGFGVQTAEIQGWGTGAWATILSTE